MFCHDSRAELREKLANRINSEQNAVKNAGCTFKPTVHMKSKTVNTDSTVKPRLRAMRPRCFEGILYPSPGSTMTQVAECFELVDLWNEMENREETIKNRVEDQRTKWDAEFTRLDISDVALDLPDFDDFVKSIEDESTSKLPSILLEAPDWETFTKELM